MRTGIFRRIFLLYAVVAISAIGFMEIYIANTVRNKHIDDLKDSLFIQIGLISDLTVHADYTELVKLVKETTGARITIISTDGKVLADSDHDSSSMDNHAQRPEIAQAAILGQGMFIRHSDTIGEDLLYLARRTQIGKDKEGYIRLSVPLREVNSSIRTLRLRLAVVITILFLVMAAVSILQTEHLRRLLQQITRFSRSLAHGEISHRLFLSGAGEFNEIAENLSSMSEKLQRTISESEDERRRLEVILKSIPDGLLIIDTKGMVELSSLSARRLFGTDRISGRLFMEVVRDSKFAELMTSVMEGAQPDPIEIRIEQPREMYLSVHVSPLFYEGNGAAGVVAIFHDITGMRRLEQVRKDFIANVSHELKTPITAIRGFADTLLEGAVDDKENAREFLKTIRSNSDRINSLVDDLMTISKIELGIVKIRKVSVSFNEIAEYVSSTLQKKAEEKGLSLKTAIDPAQTVVSADRDRLLQILTNLVDNAIKFTETGGVTFGTATDEGRPCIFIEDTGIGIPRQHIARLGERFYRVDIARSRKMGGTGLGLAIVKHLVNAHGWQMDIQSTPGKGTNIKIFI